MSCPPTLVTAFGAALTIGDVELLHSLLHSQVVYQVPGRNAASGVHHGRDQVVAQLTAPVGPATQVHDLEVTESMVDGQRGLVVVLMRGATTDAPFAVETAFHLQTDGEAIIGITEYGGDQHLLDALLSHASGCASESEAPLRSRRWSRRSP